MSLGATNHGSLELRHGLHHVLATLVLDPEVPSDGAWWARLPGDEACRQQARDGRLPLERLAELYSHSQVRASLDRALATLGLSLPGPEELAGLFRRALSHALWDTVCAPVARATAHRYHPLVGAPPIDRHRASPPPIMRETLEALLSFDTSPEGQDHPACVQWLRGQLEALGFTCWMHQPLSSAPAVIEAHRPGRGLAGHVVLYGHYDVTPLRPGARGWSTPPQVLTEHAGRWSAHGVGDNKGPLAARLAALAGIERTPALTWFIQGEEETGSAAASRVLRERLPGLQADLWLDETGYHDHEDGTLRLIARLMGAEAGASRPPDAPLTELLDGLRLLAGRWGLGTRLEVRGLNKAAVEGGCPFNKNLPVGARYLALGVNDSRSRIHGTDESVPLWTFPLHSEELQVLFHGVDRMARGQT